MMQMLNALHGNPDPSSGFAPAAQPTVAPAAPVQQTSLQQLVLLIDTPRTAYTHP